jgi:hypothetical protein
LRDSGIVGIKNGIFLHPSDLGEQLIEVIAETEAVPAVTVPPLPPPPST